MGDCLFCGESAGWFRGEHARCRARYHDAIHTMRQLAIDAALTGAGRDDLRERLAEIAKTGATDRIDPMSAERAIGVGLDGALTLALADHSLSRTELESLTAYQEHFGIEPSPEYLDRVRRAVLLANLMGGVLPRLGPRDFGLGGLPFNFMKSESLLWLFGGVEYLTEVTQREYVAGSKGMSLRVAKGVYVRTGGMRGRTVSATEMKVVDRGVVAVTTKHLYFKGDGLRGRSFRIRLDRIVSFEPYEDGVGIMRDTQRAKPEAFLTGDGWFTANLLRIGAQAMGDTGFRREELAGLDEIVTLGVPGEADDDSGLVFLDDGL